MKFYIVKKSVANKINANLKIKFRVREQLPSQSSNGNNKQLIVN